MTDSFAEVQESLRQERLNKIWHDNKRYIIGAIVGTVLLTAIISGYKSWNHAVQAKQTNLVMSLLDAPTFPDNIVPENIKLRDGLKSMVLMQAAAAHLDNDNTDQATALYSYIADNVKGAPHEHDLATLMTARLNKDTVPQDTLKPILKKKNNIWRPQALIDNAAYEATINGDYDKALSDLEAVLKTKDLSKSLREKALAMQHVYTIQQTETQQE